MEEIKTNKDKENRQIANNKKNNHHNILKRKSFWSFFFGIIFLGGLILFIFTHLKEVKDFLSLLKTADPKWLMIALAIQVATYLCAGIVWHIVIKTTKHKLSLMSLAALSLEQLSVNQFIPSGDVAGNVLIVRAMKRFGLPNSLGMEALFIDTIAYQIAFGVIILMALFVLWLYNHITSIIVGLITIFFITKVIFTIIIWMIINHKKLNLPDWIKHRKMISVILSAAENVSHQKIFSPKILLETSFYRFAIFILDAATLFTVMRSLGIVIRPSVAFTAFVIASIAGAVTLLPGGIGGFEAGCIGTKRHRRIKLENYYFRILIFQKLSQPSLFSRERDFLCEVVIPCIT